MRSEQAGFTTAEFSVVAITLSVCVVVVLGSLGAVVATGNFWYTEQGVLEYVRADQPNVERVVRSHRNVVRHSMVEVESATGARSVYGVNTNILFNYDIQFLHVK